MWYTVVSGALVFAAADWRRGFKPYLHLQYNVVLTRHCMTSLLCANADTYDCMTSLLCATADTYEVRNAAQGPHKGSKFVSAATGAPGVGRLRPRHRVHAMADAFKLLSFQSEHVQKSPQGTLQLPALLRRAVDHT